MRDLIWVNAISLLNSNPINLYAIIRFKEGMKGTVKWGLSCISPFSFSCSVGSMLWLSQARQMQLLWNCLLLYTLMPIRNNLLLWSFLHTLISFLCVVVFIFSPHKLGNILTLSYSIFVPKSCDFLILCLIL